VKEKLRLVSILLTVFLLMSAFVTPVAAGRGNGRGQERKSEQQIQYLDAEVRVIDGQPILRYETEEGYADIPFDLPAYVISADGQRVAVQRHGDAILLPTEDGFEAFPLKDFSVVMMNGQIMLLAEVNAIWLLPIAKAAVIAALKKAGVAITTVSLYVAGRLMLAGVTVTNATVTAGKALRDARMTITRPAIDRVLQAKPIIKQKLRVAGVFLAGLAFDPVLVDWLTGACIMPWCAQPARQRASFTPALMVCVHFPRHPCFPR